MCMHAEYKTWITVFIQSTVFIVTTYAALVNSRCSLSNCLPNVGHDFDQTQSHIFETKRISAVAVG